MGLSQKTKLKRGFTLVEMLTVIAISSGILVMLAVIFRTGLWEVSKASGRIEMVRNGRNALDNIQRYLSTVMPPAGVTMSDGQNLANTYAVSWPGPDMVHDPEEGVIVPFLPRVQFFTPIDHLGTTPPPTARQLVINPVSFAYEIAAIPGADPAGGQDLVLRRLVTPSPWPAGVAPFPMDITDVTVTPRLIGRRLGIPDAGAPGGFRDAMQVRLLREAGMIQVRVNVTVENISDDLNRNKALDASNASVRNQTNTITMQTVFQPPYFNL